ncbi:hypothetical protein QJS10_CPA06g01383 [Acorus calamus]|uniref:Uncharacterized protein n=1 Tax=Acorus calamus TaxID=4465 RepID=A0AAV9EJY4_ACOCL|nr:hypothetical protein QJS10_CPA06g01383 [Acorus calamus]
MVCWKCRGTDHQATRCRRGVTLPEERSPGLFAMPPKPPTPLSCIHLPEARLVGVEHTHSWEASWSWPQFSIPEVKETVLRLWGEIAASLGHLIGVTNAYMDRGGKFFKEMIIDATSRQSEGRIQVLIGHEMFVIGMVVVEERTSPVQSWVEVVATAKGGGSSVAGSRSSSESRTSEGEGTLHS